ncbi:hypothetical protein [Streptomyces boninensis]|uniref:hypothetical protein n=1 Tax=Streptomyces boninensis TaxID=2039455 RepID=UPI003B210391
MSSQHVRTLQRVIAIGALAAVPFFGAGQAASAQEIPQTPEGAQQWVKDDMSSLGFAKVMRGKNLVELHAPAMPYITLPMPM